MTFKIDELILHKKKFLSKKECDSLIQYYEDNKGKKLNEFCDHAVTGVLTTSPNDVINLEYGTPEEKLVADKTEDMVNIFMKHTEKFKMFSILRKQSMRFSHRLRLMKYEKGAWIHPHVDHEIFVYGSCSFNLNDDYEGGDFCFFNKELIIKKEKRSAIVFPSNFCFPHSISPVTKGERYAIVTWVR